MWSMTLSLESKSELIISLTPGSGGFVKRG
jgi:hypothetical protein